MLCSTARLYFSTFLLLLLGGSLLQAQHLAWRNYTTNEGLRSNEVYGMIQDSKGFLWFGTDHGICKFNGYEFIRPVDTSITGSGSVFKIVEDDKGRIWFNHLEPILSILENDTVIPWQYNQVIEPIRKKYAPFGNFCLEEDGSVWIALRSDGYLVVQPDGQYQLKPALHRNAIVFREFKDQILCALQSDNAIEAELEYNHRTNQTKEFVHFKGGDCISLGRFPINWAAQKKATGYGIWPLKDGSFIFRFLQTFYWVRDYRLVWHGRKDVFANNLIEDAEGNIWVASLSGDNQGLLRYRSMEHFKRDEFDNLLPGHTVTDVLTDHEGGLWATTSDAGVFYCKNPGLDIFNEANGLPSNNVYCLSTDASEIVYAGANTLKISAINRRTGRINHLPDMPGSSMTEMTALHYDTLTKWLWCGPNLVCFKENSWTDTRIEVPGFEETIIFPVKKISADPSGKNLWLSTTYGFFSVDRKTGLITRYPQETSRIERTFAVSVDPGGKIWVTTIKGLKTWGDDRFEPPPFSHPALRYPARNIELLPGGGIVIALRGGGLLIRDKLNRFTHLTTKEGLTADFIKNMFVTQKDVIYACSNAGLNILSPQADGSWSIKRLTVKHGLPSNQVNDVVLLGEELWVATDKGIARFRENLVNVPVPPPLLERFVVNNQQLVFHENQELSHDQNNITLQFFALHFRSCGDIPYRYRLLGADTNFDYTHTREVNFANLAPGEYVFEVQAQDEDGFWSQSATWPFKISSPWWATWWFRTLSATALMGFAYNFYRSRLAAIQKEVAEREKIRDLEAAALRAQMNPHFIFNCLQAIQSFIARNNPETAAGYLARFAKLVRLALHGSVDGYHSLAAEIEMLENYLFLEQMRFQGKFEFKVRVEDGFNPKEISIPPLLVQPFVENAVLHGLQDLENKGFVDVLFSRKGDLLEVTVTDNGNGIAAKEASKNQTSLHKSVGMMLTQKRLEILANQDKIGQKSLLVETTFDPSGTPNGTRVHLIIPITDPFG